MKLGHKNIIKLKAIASLGAIAFLFSAPCAAQSMIKAKIYFGKEQFKKTLEECRLIEKSVQEKTPLLYYYKAESYLGLIQEDSKWVSDSLEAWYQQMKSAYAKVGSDLALQADTAQITQILHDKAAIAYRRNDYQNALVCFTPLINDFNKKDYYKLAGISAEKLQRKKEAIQFYMPYANIQKQELAIYTKLIQLSKSIKDDVLLQEGLSLGLKYYPEKVSFLHEQINLIRKQTGEEFNPSILQLYIQVLSVQPKELIANFNLGAYYFNKGVQLYNKGKTQDAQTDFKQAKKYLDVAAEVAPTDQQVMSTLTQVNQLIKP